jgi:Mg2+ and Co2+ transporter CorA|tara:strand:+ start:2650 stop:2784 length:135 start_codon:yes stop_codon:yes gene_type:complete
MEGRLSERILDKIYDILVKIDTRLKIIEDSLKKEKKDKKQLLND